MRRPLLPVDRYCVKLQARIRQLEEENAYLRSMSSSGFARGTIKTPPRIEWNVTPGEEDLL